MKDGTGTQTLSGNNTYSGATTVNTGTLALVGGSQASPITVSTGASLGFTLGSPTTSSSSVDLTAGTVKITGTPSLASYTLITASSISGTPVLASPIAGYALSVTGGNTLVLAQNAGYSSWITGTFANGTVPSDKQGPNDDPANDGISNLVKYAIAGLDPTVSNGSVGTFTGNTLTFNKRQPLATDLTYVIETSPDLQPPWTTRVTQGPDNTATTISYTLPTGQGTCFERLKVVQTP